MIQQNTKQGIFSLPDEILIYILSMVPKKRKMSEVCWTFYELTCELERNRCVLRIKDESYFDDKSIFKSIMETDRQISEIHIETKIATLQHFRQLGEIFNRHGTNVTEVEWKNNIELLESETIYTLNLLPNLEVLSLGFWLIKSDVIPISERLKLPKLKELKFSYCCKNTMKLFHRLPSGIISDLSIDHCDNINLTTLFATQSNICKLDIYEKNINLVPFKYLQLTHLSCGFWTNEQEVFDQSFLVDVLSQQTCLTHLDLQTRCNLKVDNEVFRIICRLRNLQTLRLNVDGISESIQNITQLKNLNELKMLIEINSDVLQIFSLLQNHNLKRLDIISWSPVQLQALHQLAVNNPNLSSFSIEFADPIKVNFFIDNFKNLESLKIKFIDFTIDFEDCFIADGTQNKKLKDLKLIFEWPIEDYYTDNRETFLNLLKALPNLQSLYIDVAFPFDDEFLGNILKYGRNLKKITFDHYFDAKNFNYGLEELKELTSKLEAIYLQLRPHDEEFDFHPIMKELDEYFNVLNFNQSDHYLELRK